MKRVVLIVTALAVLVLGGISCTRPAPPSPLAPPEPPASYTADQVIAVARARYPVGYKDVFREGRFSEVSTPTIISVKYFGGPRAVWRVEISLPSGYRFQDYTDSKTLYFYETDGSLGD